MDSTLVRTQVEAFRVKTAYGGKAEDCFPAWYLTRRFQIPETVAIAQTSDPALESGPKGHDSAIDAFHLHRNEGRNRLVIIQSKYTIKHALIAESFREVARKGVPLVARLLRGEESIALLENKVVVNLRATLNRLSHEERSALAIDFVVIHLSGEDPEYIYKKTEPARAMLLEAASEHLSEHTVTTSFLGPADFAFHVADVQAPPVWSNLTLEAVSCRTTHSGQDAAFFYGIGVLAELVKLYNERRSELFSKNIRYFISRKANVETGPSGKIRETLKRLVTQGEDSPELFAFYHNGVTIFAREAEVDNGLCRVRDPYVLNGCQTIKTAHMFATDASAKGKLNEDLWKRVRIPVRVITTKSEELVRRVTVANNRQNSISAAALRANDSEQLELEQRFRRHNIFYQRQEGAFEQLERTNPELLADIYAQTAGSYVSIVDLARSIAAVAGEIHAAHHPNDIFESDRLYAKTFAPSHVSSIAFCVFLQNLHNVLGVVLKKNLDLEPNPGAPKPSSLTYYTMALLTRYLAKEERHGDIITFGTTLWGGKKLFREKVCSWLDNYHSKVKRELKDRFMSLESKSNENMASAYQSCLATLKLSQVDPFKAFENLDNEIEWAAPEE
ncbi:MAG: AIPR family protein [candidate division NC10 bacterium]|nr:AIPR family protein [candidate division NC10 bacterium]MDE2321005.1 AIPR family protein [candidate division NC10 bacterium]